MRKVALVSPESGIPLLSTAAAEKGAYAETEVGAVATIGARLSWRGGVLDKVRWAWTLAKDNSNNPPTIAF
jgi:hypothetical protein